MRVVWFPEPFPQIGQPLRWRHPRMAFALGWFHAYGPGPFEVVGLVGHAVLVKTELGVKPIDAVRVGVTPRAAPGPYTCSTTR